jgi:hypothetical protein
MRFGKLFVFSECDIAKLSIKVQGIVPFVGFLSVEPFKHRALSW